MLSLLNSFSFSAATVAMLSVVNKRRWYQYLFIVVALMAAERIISNTVLKSGTNIFILSVLLFLAFLRKGVPLYQQLYQGLTAAFISWLFPMLTASLIMIIAPDWHYSSEYYVLLHSVVLLSACVIRMFFHNALKVLLAFKHIAPYVTVELFVFCAISFIFPMLPVVLSSDKRKFGIICFAFLVAAFSISALFYDSQRRLLKIQFNELESRRKLKEYELRGKQHEAMAGLKHYFIGLYHSFLPAIQLEDVDAIKAVYEDKIGPLYSRLLANHQQLEKIQNKMLRNYMESELLMAEEQCRDVTINFSVSGIIDLDEQLGDIAFECVSILLPNAIDALCTHEKGLLRVQLKSDSNSLSLEVANTVNGPVGLRPTADDSARGYGLKRLNEIAAGDDRIMLASLEDGAFNGFSILSQRMYITLHEVDEYGEEVLRAAH